MKGKGKRQRQTTARPVYPIPGAIKPGTWQIDASDPARPIGATDLRKKRMVVPTEPGEASRQIQAHELGHVKWTPTTATPARVAKQWGISEALVQGIEDARLTMLLSERGIPQTHPFISNDEALVALFKACRAPDTATALLAASYGSGSDWNTVAEACDRMGTGHLPGIVDKAFSRMESSPADHAGFTGEAAGRLRDEYESWQEKHPGEGEDGKGPCDGFGASLPGAAAAFKTLQTARKGTPIRMTPEQVAAAAVPKADTADPAEASAQEIVASISPFQSIKGGSLAKAATMPDTRGQEVADPARPSTGDYKGHGGRPAATETGTRWQTLTDVETAPLKARMTKGRIPRGRATFTDAGAVPSAMHRLTSDGRPFRGRKAKAGAAGAVLIDLSGSMHLDLEDVQAIVQALPAGIVAGYSAQFLTIIGRKGRCCNAEDLEQVLTYRRPGGNESDGPALRWLAAQRGPRFWISDGAVTAYANGGAVEHASATLQNEVMQLQLRHRILRVPDVPSVISRYGKKKGRR